jgi:outer membrane lipoprotein-sorting protein
MKSKLSHAYIFLAIFLIIDSFAESQKTKIESKQIVIKEKNSDQDYIKQIEDYFNSIKTLKADFVQVDKTGRESFGVFLLKRPSKIKMDYRKPATHVVIAKNNKVIHFDKELNEKTVTSMYSSPLAFFMESTIRLKDAVKILSIVDEHGILSITFCKKDPDIDGAITMVFQKNPFMLLKWEIFNTKKDINFGNAIQVILLNHEFGKKISDVEFSDFD